MSTPDATFTLATTDVADAPSLLCAIHQALLALCPQCGVTQCPECRADCICTGKPRRYVLNAECGRFDMGGRG